MKLRKITAGCYETRNGKYRIERDASYKYGNWYLRFVDTGQFCHVLTRDGTIGSVRRFLTRKDALYWAHFLQEAE